MQFTKAEEYGMHGILYLGCPGDSGEIPGEDFSVPI
jgi:hypothetical protein